MTQTRDSKLTIYKASHFFKTRTNNERFIGLLTKFAKNFTNVDPGRDGVDVVTMFAVVNKKDNEFRFHINTLTDFLTYLKRSNVYDKDIEVLDIPKNEGLPVKLKMKPHFKPRDYQEPIIEYFESAKSIRGINKGNLIKQNFIGIQTGEGKTLTSSFCAVKYGKRILICVRPLFMKKWAQDIFEIFKVKKEETISVQGGDQLKGLISIAKEPAFKKVKIILLSLPTLRNWFTSYETLGSKEAKEHYGIDPDEFYEHMGVGLRLIDEVHIDFHFNFLHDLYTNVEKTISLSATLLNLNKFMESMYQIAYPKEERYSGGALKKYTRAFAVMYNAQYQRRINTTEWGSNMYSHIAFEKSIMNKKNGTLGNNYCGMIVDILGIKFLPTYKKGNKAVVYAASKKMCTYIADFIKKELPDYDVRRYIEGDPYENLLEADIRVTTLQSGGTGHDIKGLTDVILTNCIQSIQQNIQVLGRLREIPDGETRFYYLTCYTIPKQMQYHQQKMVMLRQRAKSIEILPYGLTL